MLLHRCTADTSFSLTRWQHFSARNDLMATLLKLWCEIENQTLSVDLIWNDEALGFFVKLHYGSQLESMTSYPKSNSVNAYLFKEQSCKFNPDPIWNYGAVGFFEEVIPTIRRRRTRWAEWYEISSWSENDTCLGAGGYDCYMGMANLGVWLIRGNSQYTPSHGMPNARKMQLVHPPASDAYC